MTQSLDDRDLSVDRTFFNLMRESHEALVGSPLVPDSADAAWLYHDAPFVVLAHNTDEDPHFIYANKAAQACFGYTWDEFVSLPSRLSAEKLERAERQRLLDAVSLHGHIQDYRGIRITKSGHRFEIEDGVVWQLADQAGLHWGQAARFSRWRELS